MVVPSCEPSCRSPNLVEAIPQALKWLYYRSADAPQQSAEKRFLKDLRAFDAAYLWPNTSIETYREAQKIGKPIFLERINCYTGKAKQILDRAYTSLGVQPRHPNTPEKIQQERIKTEIADFIFCPSLEVTKSFQEAGVPQHKLITTSYGWSPERFPVTRVLPPKLVTDEVTVLFLGSICVRKGSHILLKAWEKAGIKGKLILFGTLQPVIAEVCRDVLARPDVTHLSYNSNSDSVSSIYQKADIFAFPSLEEGSPLVTYEAMAHGLPILTSPMGAGGVVRDGIDGIIVSPYDEDAFVESLQKLTSSPTLRDRLGQSAYQRAKDFTWEKTAFRRQVSILRKLDSCLAKV
jgi:glycosyltransferase involved in cell wall biosynthesis